MAAASPSASDRPAPGPLYLDNLATTPLDPRVLEVMLPFFAERFGNPSSRTHAYGWDAAAAVEAARSQVAALIGARAREVVFTSGATEANNLAIKGVAESWLGTGAHLVTCVTEHHAVLDVFASLEARGFRVTRVPVDPTGCVDLARLREALDDDAALLSIMAANNETGTLHPLAEIGSLVQERGVVWHCDAAQAVGKVPVDLESLPVDLLSLSAHKIYGPKGQGALFVRRRRPPLRLAPQLEGGGQERGLRSGTLNVPGIVGLGEACRLCAQEMGPESARIAAMRDRLEARLEREVPGGVAINGHRQRRLPGALNASFPGIDGAALLLGLRDLALSSGSACTSGSKEPSHVLKAMGRDATAASSSLRFGFGRFNAPGDAERVAQRVAAEVERQRAGPPPPSGDPCGTTGRPYV